MNKMLGVVCAVFVLAGNVLAAEYEAQGTVNAVNVEKRTLNISHGAIKGLGMDAMTMDFPVADPAMLKEVKVGQQVKFVLSTDSRGHMAISDIEARDQAFVTK
ncbi:MAG: copper-binding protein [Gammaproteobacteria bacterium]|nr:copper-binding protein [Gammaproteobacteria bacterium]